MNEAPRRRSSLSRHRVWQTGSAVGGLLGVSAGIAVSFGLALDFVGRIEADSMMLLGKILAITGLIVGALCGGIGALKLYGRERMP
jgi:hypothetical protein